MFCKRLWDRWTAHIQVKFKKELLFTCPRFEHLSLPQKPYSLGSGRWQTCLRYVGEFSKNLRQFHFRCFFSENSHHTFSKQLSDITSSHHLISPEEWSLPFRNGWTSNLAASDLSQYHYWGALMTMGRILSTDFAMKQVRKSSWWLCHKWAWSYLIFNGPVGTGIKDFARLCSYSSHVWRGV